MKYTTSDLSKIFGVITGTVSRWARRGLIKGEFKRNKWSFAKDQVKELMDKQGIKKEIPKKSNKIKLPTVNKKQYKSIAKLSEERMNEQNPY